MSWELDYKKKLRTADEALTCVQSGMRVYIQPGCAEPETLVEALMRRGPDVQDVGDRAYMNKRSANERIYQWMTWQEIADEAVAGSPVVIPIGATEQHGPHLPVCTDWVLPAENGPAGLRRPPYRGRAVA